MKSIKDPAETDIEIINDEEPGEKDVELIADMPKKEKCPKWGCFSRRTEILQKEIFVIGYGFQKMYHCKECDLIWCIPWKERGCDE